MLAQLFWTAILFLFPAPRPTGPDPLPEPVPVRLQLGHHLCEEFVNGPDARKKISLICTLAGRPAVLIYAREIDATLLDLIKKLDAVARAGSELKMKSSCVLLTNKDKDQERLQEIAQNEKLEATILAVTPYEEGNRYFASWPRCPLHKEAAVTVIVLQRLRVEKSYAFRKGGLNDRNVEEIVQAAAALLPTEKK
jgi:hypothetical protein